jgi:hypothetical protein
VRVIKDGHGASYPPLASLERLCDFAGLGITRTRLRSLNGADWTRTIIWVRGSAFLVLDDLLIEEAGDYSIECLWRTLGQPQLSGPRLDVQQTDLIFTLLGSADTRVTHWLTQERATRKAILDAYPHAEPVVHVLHQLQEGVFEPGDAVRYANLLCAPTRSEAVEAALLGVGNGLQCVTLGDTIALAGTPAQPVTEGDLRLRTEALHWSPRRLTLCGCTELETGDHRITCPEPFDLDLDLAALTGELLLPGGALESLQTVGYQLSGKPQEIKDSDRLHGHSVTRIRVQFPASEAKTLRTAWQAISRERQELPGSRHAQSPRAAQRLEPAWRRPIPAPVTACASLSGGEGFLLGDARGSVCRYHPDGEAAWTAVLGAPVRALLPLRTADSERPQIVAGTAAAEVHLLSDQGRTLWTRALHHYHAFGDEQRITALCELPRSQGSGPQILAGTEGHHVFAIDAGGAVTWHQWARYHAVTALAAGDLLGDGRAMVVVGTEYHTPINVMDSSGNLLWYTWEQVGSEARSTTVRSGTDVRVLKLADVNGDVWHGRQSRRRAGSPGRYPRVESGRCWRGRGTGGHV